VTGQRHRGDRHAGLGPVVGHGDAADGQRPAVVVLADREVLEQHCRRARGLPAEIPAEPVQADRAAVARLEQRLGQVQGDEAGAARVELTLPGDHRPLGSLREVFIQTSPARKRSYALTYPGRAVVPYPAAGG
jgi:hypothetical protein